MFQLLLVDDEPAILEGLCHNIDWEQLNISLVWKATDAAQAMERLHASKIDVVISDICMADQDGLKLSQTVKKLWPSIKIILLTGYKEFSYAQKAVELGVFQYLLKPVSYAEIERTVQSALHEIIRGLNQVEILEKSKAKLREATAILREHFLFSWIVSGKTGVADNQKMLRECALDLSPEEYGFLLVFHIDDTKTCQADARLLEIACQDILHKILGDSLRLTSLTDEDDAIIVLIHEPEPEHLQNAIHHLKDSLDMVQLSISTTFQYKVSIFWDSLCPFSHLHSSYLNIQMRIKRSSFFGEEALIGPDPEDEKLKEKRIDSLYAYPAFPVLVETLQRQEACERIRLIFQEIGRKVSQMPDTLLEAYHIITGALISDSCRRGVSIHLWDRDLADFLEGVRKSDVPSEIRDNCLEVTMRYLDYVIGSESHSVSRLAESVRLFIESNYSQNISVVMVAGHFNYNPSYLTRVFKKETGYSIGDYIIKIRIEKAKAMLRKPGSKVSDICEQVGFHSFPHFSRLFKKQTGVSPRQFQT